MKPSVARERSLPISEMMKRLGIEPGGGVLPQSGLRYATALRRCEACAAQKTCREWLDHAHGGANLAPRFCMNADIFFELQYDEPGPRLESSLHVSDGRKRTVTLTKVNTAPCRRE